MLVFFSKIVCKIFYLIFIIKKFNSINYNNNFFKRTKQNIFNLKSQKKQLTWVYGVVVSCFVRIEKASGSIPDVSIGFISTLE